MIIGKKSKGEVQGRGKNILDIKRWVRSQDLSTRAHSTGEVRIGDQCKS